MKPSSAFDRNHQRSDNVYYSFVYWIFLFNPWLSEPEKIHPSGKVAVWGFNSGKLLSIVRTHHRIVTSL